MKALFMHLCLDLYISILYFSKKYREAIKITFIIIYLLPLIILIELTLTDVTRKIYPWSILVIPKTKFIFYLSVTCYVFHVVRSILLVPTLL